MFMRKYIETVVRLKEAILTLRERKERKFVELPIKLVCISSDP